MIRNKANQHCYKKKEQYRVEQARTNQEHAEQLKNKLEQEI